jgi:hypothetical protein
MYKTPSIISGTGGSIWSQIIFGPTGHHQTRSSPLPRAGKVPSALQQQHSFIAREGSAMDLLAGVFVERVSIHFFVCYSTSTFTNQTEVLAPVTCKMQLRNSSRLLC